MITMFKKEFETGKENSFHCSKKKYSVELRIETNLLNFPVSHSTQNELF